jgi:Sulfotransferase family
VFKRKDFFSLPHDLRRKCFAVCKNADFKKLQNKRSIVTKEGYSYKPFDQYQCIFVHIPKDAGVSICRSLFGNLCGGHTSIGRYKIIFSKKEFDSYFKFTFARNPWDRIFSAYNFLKKGGVNQANKRWAAANLASCENFDDFIRKHLTPPGIYKQIHFKPQYEFLCFPYYHRLSVDFLGFYENLQSDFEYIKNKLSLDASLTLSHENVTATDDQQLDYRDFYTDETRDIVGKVYKRDIELLGYNFDNSSLKAQLKNRSV